jgi:environmental stress-induced protein Ves
MIVDDVPHRVGVGDVVAYPGEATVSATLLDGPVTFLNLIADRGCRGEIRVRSVDSGWDVAPEIRAILFVPVTTGGGPAVLTVDDGVFGASDVLVPEGDSLTLHGRGTVVEVAIPD